MKVFKIAMLVIVAMFFHLTACQNEKSNTSSNDYQTQQKDIQLFELTDNNQTGIQFNNKLVENEIFNFMTYDAIYQGGGVGIIDVNNDGLKDIFFTGNMTMDALYLNKGNLQFEDISAKANINKGNGWSSGVAIADVNNDGWEDIYITKFLLDEHTVRKNQLFINNGDLTFTESAEKYGIADMGFGINATFFDYDKDGWLDLYIANQPPNHKSIKDQMKGKINYVFTDKLFKNNGNGTFLRCYGTSGNH